MHEAYGAALSQWSVLRGMRHEGSSCERSQCCNEQHCFQVDLRQYINELMVSTGACASAGYPIASCKIYSDKSYAFLEFRSVEEASNCMAFDGVAFKDSYLRVRPEVTAPNPPSGALGCSSYSV